MSDFSDENGINNDAWYAFPGVDSDVVLSTRVRIARNLASFPFPGRFKDDDPERVKSIVFDSFAHCREPDKFQGLYVSDLDFLGEKILIERGILESSSVKRNGCAVVIRTDGKLSCLVNDIDHVRLSSFVPGLDGEAAFRLCHDLDEELQNTMQFAANYDSGYLTSEIKDCGSGMKVSCRVHLPSLSFTGKLSGLYNYFEQKQISVVDAFGAGAVKNSSLGFYYQISTLSAGNGNEIDQLASLVSAVKYVTENERREKDVVLRLHQTELRDRIYRTYAKLKFASLIDLREAIDIISDIKWGKNLGFFSGISDEALCALLYRIQNAHIQFVLKNKKFNFPVDIADNDELKANHLRALILQESFENLKVN